MQITYSNRLDDLSASQLDGFFVGWQSHPNREMHLEILRRSYAIWLALDGGQCVGFVNSLSDGLFYAFIPLLEVLPDYQGCGIGTELIERMVKTLDKLYAVDIVCDESIAGFYKRLEFSQCVGRVKRNYGRQELRV